MMRRRDVMGLLAGGLTTSLAGCGYRPGGGDYRWTNRQPMGFSEADAMGTLDDLLVAITDSSYGYDFEREAWTRGGRIATCRTDGGIESWSERLPADVRARAIGDRPVVGFEDSIRVYDLLGEHWELSLDDQPIDVAAAGGHAHVLTAAGTLVAAREGSELWQVDLADDDRELMDDGRERGIVTANGDGIIYARGDTIGRVAPDASRQWTRSPSSMVREVWLSGDAIFLRTRSALLEIDAATGQRRWREPYRIDSLAVTEGGRYCVADGDVLALDRSGERRWHVEDMPGRDTLGTDRFDAVAADDRGVFATTDDGVLRIDPTEGRIHWHVTHDSVSAGPFLAESGVIVAADGELVCHQP